MKKENKSDRLEVRIKPSILEKIKKICSIKNLSQSKLIEFLVEKEFNKNSKEK